MKPKGNILAIDQSTSSTKAMIVLPSGKIQDKKTLAHKQIYPQPGWVEHDAEEIYQNVLGVISELFNEHAEKAGDLIALSITNQRETFVVFERETGKPLHNAIVWQCRRGNDFCKQLIRDGHENTIHRSTGLKIDTYFPASKLYWLIINHPELAEMLEKGTALFGTIDTYLIYRLTGGKVYATDHTNASRTLFYDIGQLCWSQALCDIFQAKFAQLPDVRESADKFGETDLDGLLKRPIPICGVMGDSQAALFAQKCFKPGGAKVTFGTGSSILLNIGHEKPDDDADAVTALAWVINQAPTYAYEGIINFTGATIAWLRDQLEMITNASETEEIAKSVADSGGVYLVPAFVGLSAPYWRADVRAAILGITPSTTRAHIVRAALESIGYIVTDVLTAMSEDAGVRLSVIHADGGASQNRFLMQFVADLNQIEVRAADTAELSALGAVFQAWLRLGLVSSLDEIEKISAGYTVFTPQMHRENVNQLYNGWKIAISQVLY